MSSRLSAARGDDRRMTKCEAASSSKRQAALQNVRRAALETDYVSLGSRRTASPHEFYRYPGRFPPSLARSVIEAFTEPGDLVLDPFLGGGTTLVEARLLSRLGVGSDLNPLAVFVSKVKTRPHSQSELDAVARWVDRLPRVLAFGDLPAMDEWVSGGYFRNLDSPELSDVRRALEQARHSLRTIYPSAAESFARCILLRAGQWALDMRKETPPLWEFAEKLASMGDDMVEAATQYRRQVRTADSACDARGNSRTTILRQALPGLAERLAERFPAPRLILTSPPYPGVYVNYHRWKVLGRKETPALFWLADRRDGNGLSFYTMGARSDRTRNNYFSQLQPAFADLHLLADRRTILVQVVGFHDPDEDLPRYLAAMECAGFTEVDVPELATETGRLWRAVPNRRWWVQDGNRGTNTAREVLLVHRRAS
jgi:hypothetical protein